MLYLNPTETWKMRPRMKYSNSKISPAKCDSTSGRALVPPCKITSKSLSVPALITIRSIINYWLFQHEAWLPYQKLPRILELKRKRRLVFLNSLYITTMTICYNTGQGPLRSLGTMDECELSEQSSFVSTPSQPSQLLPSDPQNLTPN